MVQNLPFLKRIVDQRRFVPDAETRKAVNLLPAKELRNFVSGRMAQKDRRQGANGHSTRDKLASNDRTHRRRTPPRRHRGQRS
jgi:hypothetical protein